MSRLEPKGDNASIEEVIRNCAGLAYAGRVRLPSLSPANCAMNLYLHLPIAGAESVCISFIHYAFLSFNRSTPQTTSTLATFVLAMVLNPQALHKAQAELDEVVGHSRLPDAKDRPQLPYVSAIVKEVLR